MKVVHTFWSGPPSNEDLVNMKSGWLSSEYHWMSWLLSCLQALKIFGQIELVTDNRGKELLVDRLKLPYTKVSTELEGRLDNYPHNLWSLAKIYSYSIQNEPFMHIDGDVYYWQHPGKEFTSSALFAQNQDINLQLYAESLDELNAKFTYIPPLLSTSLLKDKDLLASNAGTIGGNDSNFFSEYAAKAFEFIDANKSCLNNVDVYSLNFIVEQFLYNQTATEQGKEIKYLMPPVDDHNFDEYVRFEDIPQILMSHTVGNFKMFPHMCLQIAKILRCYYPEHFIRIISNLAKHKNDLHLKYFLESAVPTSHNSRSAKTIEYLRTKYNLIKPSENQIPLEDMITTEDSDRLSDIKTVEKNVNLILKDSYSTRDKIETLYQNDVKHYGAIKELFSKIEEEILETSLKIAKDVSVIKTKWRWNYDYESDITLIINRNFETSPEDLLLILLPVPMLLSVKEYYLDKLDTIILDYLEFNGTSINEIVNYASDFFPKKEIQENNQKFKNLMLNTLKLLLYHGILEVDPPFFNTYEKDNFQTNAVSL